MHEVHAALAAAFLKQMIGRGRQSEEEFYARFGGGPWRRFKKYSLAAIDKLALKKVGTKEGAVIHQRPDGTPLD